MSGEPEELGMSWDMKLLFEASQDREAYLQGQITDIDLELAYAKNDIHDLLNEVENLRAEVSDLEYEAEVHECYEDHDDCFCQEDLDEVKAGAAKSIKVHSVLKDWREELYWRNSRTTNRDVKEMINGVIDAVDQVLEVGK